MAKRSRPNQEVAIYFSNLLYQRSESVKIVTTKYKCVYLCLRKHVCIHKCESVCLHVFRWERDETPVLGFSGPIKKGIRESVGRLDPTTRGQRTQGGTVGEWDRDISWRDSEVTDRPFLTVETDRGWGTHGVEGRYGM